MAAALPRPPQMLSGRIGEGEEEGLDPGRSGEVGRRWRSGRWPGRGDSLLHQSCELKHCLLHLLIFHRLIPGQIVLPLLATEEVTTVHLVSIMNPDFNSPPSSYSMSKCVQSDDRKVDMTRQPDMKMNQMSDQVGAKRQGRR